MAVRPEDQHRLDRLKFVLAKLKEAREASSEPDSFIDTIRAYEQDIDYIENPPQEPEVDAVERAAREQFDKENPDGPLIPIEVWDAGHTYSVGDLVEHEGQVYYALPDVAVGTPPDDVYDLSGETGGWAPVGAE